MNNQLKIRIFSIITIFSMLLTAVGMPTGTALAAGTYTISGNAGLAAATITYTGGSTTANGSGDYSFTVNGDWLGRWSGTVTPAKTGYTFSPTSRTYNNIRSSQTGQDYTATLNTYTISGSVGAAGEGATITYTGGSTTANATTGSYSFTVSYGWSGTVTPTKTDYTFSPGSRSYTNVTANQTNQNYTATAIVFTISGNTGVGSCNRHVYGWLDNFEQSVAPIPLLSHPGGPARLHLPRPDLALYASSRTYTNVTADQTAQNYTARPTAFTFASMGDGQAETTYFSTTSNQIASLNPALVIFNGDLEDTGFILTEMNPMVNALKSANLFNKTYLVRGNADNSVEGSAALWESYFETAPEHQNAASLCDQ